MRLLFCLLFITTLSWGADVGLYGPLVGSSTQITDRGYIQFHRSITDTIRTVGVEQFTRILFTELANVGGIPEAATPVPISSQRYNLSFDPLRPASLISRLYRTSTVNKLRDNRLPGNTYALNSTVYNATTVYSAPVRARLFNHILALQDAGNLPQE